MRLFSYIVRWDHGFAPNPFYGVCTLATCKPKIRTVAKVGDYVLGTGSKPRGLAGAVVYFMRVDEVLTFDTYWRDPRFARKIPVMNGSLQQRFGDNIYHREVPNGEWIQSDSRHSREDGGANLKNLTADTGLTDRVLVSHQYTYWGAEGPKVPASLKSFVHDRSHHRSWYSEDEIGQFLEWAQKKNATGYSGDPVEWQYEHRWR
ncbi:MAG: hypothetical protein WCA78_09595 [Rhizomicrobium sp.]